MVEPGIRLRSRRGRVLDRLVDDAEQAEPGPGRARPRPGRAGDRRVDRGAGDAQGPAAGLPARPPGGQGTAVRGGRRRSSRRSGCWPGWSTRLRVDRDADAGRGRGRLHDRDGGRRRARPPGRCLPGAHHVVGEARLGRGGRRGSAEAWRTTRSRRRWRPSTPRWPGTSRARLVGRTVWARRGRGGARERRRGWRDGAGARRRPFRRARAVIDDEG